MCMCVHTRVHACTYERVHVCYLCACGGQRMTWLLVFSSHFCSKLFVCFLSVQSSQRLSPHFLTSESGASTLHILEMSVAPNNTVPYKD